MEIRPKSASNSFIESTTKNCVSNESLILCAFLESRTRIVITFITARLKARFIVS